MNRIKLLGFVAALCICNMLNAQIFINTGNPNLDKYKNENPNAVIWENGKNVPIPPNTPVEPKKEPVKKAVEAKKEKVKTEVEAPVSNEPAVKAEAPAKKQAAAKKEEPVKTEAPVKKQAAVKKDEPMKAEAPKAGSPSNNGAPMDYPLNAVPGKCYARCMSPDQYEIKEEQVVDKPASVSVEKRPAKYETVYDTVVVVPAAKRTVTVPAQYETVTEDKLVTPASQKWVKGTADKNCLSANPKDCEVWCLKEIPAVYQKVSKKVEKVAASTNIEEVPAVTKVVPRKQLVWAASEVKTEIPPTYKTVMKKVLVKKGGFQEWKEVLCEPEITESKIASIQEALKREGYDAGPTDNQMGGKTKQALIKFQQDKGLPVGNLNLETLKALGIKE